MCFLLGLRLIRNIHYLKKYYYFIHIHTFLLLIMLPLYLCTTRAFMNYDDYDIYASTQLKVHYFLTHTHIHSPMHERTATILYKLEYLYTLVYAHVRV